MFEQFAAAITELRSLGGLPSFEQAEDVWQDLWHSEVHHSTAVEGNTLVLREVEALLEQGRVVGAKDLKDYMEVLGYAEASRWVFDQAGLNRSYLHDELVTITELRHLHQMTMGHVWQVAPHPAAEETETPGSYRQHEIRAFPGGMKPPTFPLIPALIDAWVAQVNDFGRAINSGGIAQVDAPLAMARIHVEFERIHPFLDGNGRTGRLVLNLILTRLGWPPIVILKTQRQRYLNALIKADNDNAEPLAELLAQAAIASLHRL
ncbi:MAG: Fic family protein, partial [Propionibacteriaceae bacterium]|nr:Fic family protein [Propionibacteriaceae bacterium]